MTIRRSRKAGRRHRRTRRMRGGNEPSPAMTSMSPAPVGGSRRHRRRRGGNFGLAAVVKDALVPAALFYGATRVSRRHRK